MYGGILSTTAIEKDGQYFCPECNYYMFRVVAHLDAREYTAYIYNCTKCNAVIKTKYKKTNTRYFRR